MNRVKDKIRLPSGQLVDVPEHFEEMTEAERSRIVKAINKNTFSIMNIPGANDETFTADDIYSTEDIELKRQLHDQWIRDMNQKIRDAVTDDQTYAQKDAVFAEPNNEVRFDHEFITNVFKSRKFMASHNYGPYQTNPWIEVSW